MGHGEHLAIEVLVPHLGVSLKGEIFLNREPLMGFRGHESYPSMVPSGCRRQDGAGRAQVSEIPSRVYFTGGK
jgi:hypothetical protein